MSNLFETTTEPAGDTCAAGGGVCTYGGVKLETGEDANTNGILDDPEVT